MNKTAKRTLWLALALVALGAAVLAWLATRPTHAQRGSVAELRDLCLRAYEGDTNAVLTLQARGSNAVPGLTVLLQARDSWWRETIWAWLPKLPLRWSVRIAQRVGPPTATRTREAAARGLGLLGTNAVPAASELARALRQSEGRIRQEATLALARIGPAAVPYLTDALRDALPQVRQAAAFALGEIGPPARGAVPLLAQRLGDGDEWVRRTCAATLARVGLDGLQALIEAANRPFDPARETAQKLLDEPFLPTGGAELELQKMATDADAAVRRRAVETLAAVRALQPTALSVAYAALKDPDAPVRVAAIECLGKLGPDVRGAAPVLQELLRDPAPTVRARAAWALGRIASDDETVRQSLTEALQDADVHVRDAARQALRSKPGRDGPVFP